MSKKIINLPSGSINDTSIGFIGDPNTGALTETSYKAMKDYFQTGVSSLLTGSYVTTASFNIFSASYHNDSSSFSGNIKNVYASQSSYTLTSSFLPLSQSYSTDSGSFDIRIKAISGSLPSGSYVTTTTFGVFSASVTIDSSSFNNRISNLGISQSGLVPTSSYNPFTASYITDSGSFLNRINNVFASESNYLPTSSFISLSGSIVNNSSSFDTRINNVFSSESRYLTTSSIFGNNNYIPVFSGSQGFTYGVLYYSGSSLLINQVNGLNNALLQVAGPVSINDASYLLLPRGTTAQRPTGSFAMIRGNTETTNVEFYNGSQWISLGSGSGIFSSGSVTSVGLSLPSIFNVSNSPIVGAGVLSSSFNTQSANLFFASPDSTSGVPIFRSLTISDISALTSSFIAGYVLTGSFNQFTSSYQIDSSSILLKITNTFASESNYVPTSSYNPFTASILLATASINNNLNNVYSSQSNYVLTSSFVTFSASYYNDSSSNLNRSNNVFASQSNYLPTSSILGRNGYLALFSGSSAITQSSLYQSGSFIIMGRTGSLNDSLLQIFGSIFISGSIYDSTNSTGSVGQVLVVNSNSGNLIWTSTGSGNWSLVGNSISSGSFIGTTNVQDLIFKRNNVQVASFLTNNNIIFGNSNNNVTGSNSVVLSGVNNFANNMSAVINGANNISVGNSSVVVGGQGNVTPGIGSVTLGGINLSASSAYSIVGGRFNDPIIGSNSSSWIISDPLLILGNGSSTSSLSNALVVYKNGTLSLPAYTNTSSANVLSVDEFGMVTNTSIFRGIQGAFAMFGSSNFVTSSVLFYSGSISVGGQINILSNTSLIIGPANSNVLTGANLNSFAVGNLNTISANGVIANGFNNTGSGANSHAEGQNTNTIGQFSHAEGSGTRTIGQSSHAEGQNTIAFGNFSHAEGIGTISSGSGQLAIGKWNSQNNTSSLLIIGNGVTGSQRSDLAIFESDFIQFNQDLYLSGSLHLSSSIYDSFGNPGGIGQLLSSTGNGLTKWIDVSGSSGINGFVTNGIFQTYTQSAGITSNNIYASQSNYVLTSSFVTFSASYYSASSSFNQRINNVFASESNYLSTSSYIADSSSLYVKVNNIYASESNYTSTASFNILSQSYSTDSGSFDIRIKSILGLNITGSYVTTGSFNTYTGSVAVTLNNIILSQSRYTLTSSFNSLSSSYSIDSSSFSTQIINIFTSQSNYVLNNTYVTASASLNTRINNVFSSESNYTLTSSFLSLSGSYLNDSSSFNTRINNVFASESNYVPTSSLRGLSNYLSVFSGSNAIVTSSIYQSTGSILIGSTTSINNSLLQIFGNIYISGSIYDSTNSTGSVGQVLVKTQSGIKWINSGSGGTTVYNFILGDGQSFTPASGSTIFSSSLIANRTVLQFFQEGALLSPISRSVGWYSVSSSIGKINLNNATFDTDTFYSLVVI
jgi:hypothetical protein